MQFCELMLHLAICMLVIICAYTDLFVKNSLTTPGLPICVSVNFKEVRLEIT